MKVGQTLDKLISVFAPKWANTRMAYRNQFHLNLKRAAGTWDRTSGRNKPKLEGPVDRSRRILEPTRRQARDLYHTNAYARGVVNSIVVNLVGTGMRPEPKVMQPRLRKPDEKVNKALKEAWKRWADHADLSGRVSFYEIQELVCREKLIVGESLIIKQVPKDREKERIIPLALEVIPPERLDESLDKETKDRNGKVTGKIIQGIEFDNSGKIIAYWILPNHPYDSTTGNFSLNLAPVRVDADRVLHVYEQSEPGQVRGLSPFIRCASVIEKLDQFLDNELTKAQVASMFGVMIKQAGDTVSLPKTGNADDDEDDAGNEIGYLESGMIWRGEPGESLEVAQPAVQSSAIVDFVSQQLRQVAVAFDVSYEIVSRDLSKVTYLSARQGENMARKHWEPLQETICRQFNCPIWEEFVNALTLVPGTGLRIGDQSIDRFLDVEFGRPGWPWVDPQKEIRAVIEGIQGGIVSAPEEIRKRGGDPLTVIEENAEFKTMAEDAGLSLGIFAGANGGMENGEEDAAGEEENTEDGDAKATPEGASTASSGNRA